MLRILTLFTTVWLLAGAAQAETIRFAGHEWLVRDYPGGPGPNSWDVGNVFVDEAGLHLRISKIGGVWTCAEVILTQPLGFGTYSFDITGRPDKLDRNAVLGLFTFPDEDVGPSGTNEIDIEFARWGSKTNPNVLNWTVYPPELGPRSTNHHVPMALKTAASSHSFIWNASSVAFASHQGYAGDGGKLIARWTTGPATEIPQSSVPVHINLWLLDGKAPADGKPVEIVIRNFAFTPS